MNKKLVFRAFLLLFGIASLWALLWIYPRQQGGAISSSFTADSQKVVQSSQKPKIVFAGLSGDSPRYIDSGLDRGTGWIDVQTLGIQKGLRARGYEVENLWMTPARIEHEIQTGQPLCTYPVKWKDPSRLFAKKPDRLYSIALDFEEEEAQSLVIKKSKFERIRKHLDAKGDLSVLSLVEDPSLKTLLIRDKDYGDLTWKLTTKDVSGGQIARTQYEKYIALRVVRDSRQLIEMLNADRFDYLLGNRLEDLDFEGTKISKEAYFEIKYSATHGIRSLADSQVIRSSIVCSIHPLMFQVIPILNTLISKERGAAWKARMTTYKRHFTTGEWNIPILESFFLAGRFSGQLGDGTADQWYSLQQRHFPDLGRASATEDQPENFSLPLLPSKKGPITWHAIETPDHQHLVLSEGDSYHRWMSDADFQERTFYYATINTCWNHRILESDLNDTLLSKLNEPEWLRSSEGLKEVHFKQLMDQLSPLGSLSPKIRDLTLFAGGLVATDALGLKAVLGSPILAGLRVVDANPEFLNSLLPMVGNQVHSLELIQSSVTHGAEQSLLQLLGRLKGLRRLGLTSTTLDPSTLTQVIALLPHSLESLSLSSNSTAFSKEAVEALARARWTKLRKIDLSDNQIFTPDLERILRAVPPTLQTLRLNSNGGDIPHSMIKFAEFFPRLERIDMVLMSYDAPKGERFHFPATARQLYLNQGTFNSKKVALPDSLEVLDVSDMWIEVKGISDAIQKLGPLVKILNLSKTKLQLSDLELLVKQTQIQTISKLDLSQNDLDDRAVEILSRAKFRIESLNLSKNLIRNTGAQRIAARFLPTLKRLNLSENPISSLGVEAIARSLPQGLVALDLASLLPFEVAELAAYLPKSLRKLDLSSNHLSDADLQILLPRLPETLQDLDLSGADLSPIGIGALAKGLPRKLSFLALSQVKINPQSLAHFASQMPSTLTELKMGPLQIDFRAAEVLSQGLPPQLRVLDIGVSEWKGSPAQTDRAKELLLATLPSSLQRLNLQAILSPKAVSIFSKNIPPNLRWLKLQGQIGDEGMMALAENLPSTIESLRLDGNQLTDRGIAALAKNLPASLGSLSLANNQFSVEGIRSLCAQERSLVSLNVTATHLDAASVDALNKNCVGFLKRLYIGNNPIGNAAMARLLKRLDPYFTFINAPSVGLTANRFEDVVRSLPSDLVGIELNGNDIGAKGYELLEKETSRRNEEGRFFLLYR